MQKKFQNKSYKYFSFQVLFRPIFSTNSMHTDFVVLPKGTIFGLDRDLKVYFDLYVPYFQKRTWKYIFLLLLVLVKPICSNISVHTDFVVHAKLSMFWPNIYAYILKCMFPIFKKKIILKDHFVVNQLKPWFLPSLILRFF